MPVRKRGALYFLDTRVNGVRHRVSLGTRDYYAALDKARELSRILGKSSTGGIRAITFDDFVTKYLDWAWASKPKTAGQEEGRLKVLSRWMASQELVYLSDIKTYHLDHLRGYIRSLNGRGERPIGKTTVNRYMQIVRCLFYRAIEWGDYTGENPMRRIRFYPETVELRALTDQQVDAVMGEARAMAADPRSPLQRVLPDLFEFILNAGLRKTEALGLKWSDVRNNGAALRVTGKGGRSRTVPLNETAAKILQRRPRRDEYVFFVPNRFKGGNLRRSTETISRRVGFPFHIHLLRHTFATRLLASGVDIVTISALLGHGRSMTTLLYAHTDEARKYRAVDTLKSMTVPTKRAHGTGINRAPKTRNPHKHKVLKGL